MLSRIIKKNKDAIGTAMILIGIFWMMGVVGTDDYNTARNVATPMIWLIVKTMIGFVILGTGARISKGGRR